MYYVCVNFHAGICVIIVFYSVDPKYRCVVAKSYNLLRFTRISLLFSTRKFKILHEILSLNRSFRGIGMKQQNCNVAKFLS